MQKRFNNVMLSGVIGAISFLCLYLATDWTLEAREQVAWRLALLYAGYSGTGVLLIFLADLSYKKLAASIAFVSGLSFALSWSLFSRYVPSSSLWSFDIGMSFFVLTLGITFLLPFIRNFWINGRKLDYPTLYTSVWFISLSNLLSLIFAAIGMGVLYLLAFALSTVDIDALSKWLEVETFFFASAGFFYGLSMGVAHIQVQIIEALRKVVALLLLLLMPLMFVAVTLIAVRIPFVANNQGTAFSLMNGFSQTGALIALVAISSSILTAWAVRKLNFAEFGTPRARAIITNLARVLCIALIPLAVFSIWGIYVRINAYGLTPDRVDAVLFVIDVCIYGFGYGLVAIWPKGDWAGRIQKVNIIAGINLVALCLLSATPLLNAQRLSVNSQYERYAQSPTEDNLHVFWDMQDWGRDGVAMAEKMRAQGLDIDAARGNSYALSTTQQTDAESRLLAEAEAKSDQELKADLKSLVKVFDGQEPVAIKDEWLDTTRNTLIEAWGNCQLEVENYAPVCVAIKGQFSPSFPPYYLVITRLNRASNSLLAVRDPSFDIDAFSDGRRSLQIQLGELDAKDTIERLKSGDFEVVPQTIDGIQFGDSPAVIVTSDP